MGRRRPQPGDVFRIPLPDARVAYAQVLSQEDGLVHLVVFDGLHDDADGEHDLDRALRRPVVLYAWTSSELFGTQWRVVGNRPIDRDALPPIEYVEMAEPERFQVVDYDGNVLRPATREEVENAPFRTIVSPRAVDEAVKAWNGGRPWDDSHLTLRPWADRNADRDDEATRLLRRFRGLDESPTAPDADTVEKIHYFVFRDGDAASAAEGRLREVGTVWVDRDDASWLVAVSTTVASSPSTAELERLAAELGGEFDGSETELG